MTTNLYVDETKAKGYLVVAATIATAAELSVIRKDIKTLILPGQRSLHMRDERVQRRAKIADTLVAICSLGVGATIYDTGKQGTERERRARAIAAIIDDVAELIGHVRITFDRDDSVVKADQQQLIELLRKKKLKDRVNYTHQHRHGETLLAIPDAIAWCWARGGHWRERIRPMVTQVHTI